MRNVEAWVFDLDNTLYAASALYDAIGDRMTAHIARALGVSDEEALVLRERYFHEYGATVVGLARHHALDAQAFLDDVHKVDYSVLDPDEELSALIGALPGRKIVFTNGGGGHGQRALAQLAIAHHFELVFDIEATGLSPKPQREAYDRLIAVCGLNPACTVLIEDSLRNLKPAHEAGFVTVLVGPEAPSPRPAFVDHWAPDLRRFLTERLSTSGAEPR